MKPRIEPALLFETLPAVRKALREISACAAASSLERRLLELVKIRASQINGCAFCLDMHVRDARKLGESEERIFLLDAWRESPCYSGRERAALAWTEALTLLTQGHVPDAVFDEASAALSETELAHLTAAVVAINSWNRICVAYRLLPALPEEAAA